MKHTIRLSQRELMAIRGSLVALLAREQATLDALEERFGQCNPEAHFWRNQIDIYREALRKIGGLYQIREFERARRKP